MKCWIHRFSTGSLFEGVDDNLFASVIMKLFSRVISHVSLKQMEMTFRTHGLGFFPDTVVFCCGYLVFQKQVPVNICVLKMIALIYH